MPFKLRCPNQHLLMIKDELAGLTLHCPVCHAQIGKQAEPVPLAPGEVLTEFDWALTAAELPKPQGHDTQEKKRVQTWEAPRSTRWERRQGIRVIGHGLLLLAVAMMLFLLAVILWQVPLVVMAMPWVVLASLVCEVAGTLLLFRVPREAGARGTLLGALMTVLLRVGLLALTLYLLPDWIGTWKLAGLLGLDLLVWMTHKVFLFWALHLVAEYVDAEGNTHDIRRLLHQALVLPVLSALWYLFAPLAMELPLWLGPLGTIVSLATGLALVGWWGLYLIRYLALMLTLREIIRTGAAGTP